MYFQLTAKKEHLSKHCRNCQYSWREDTADMLRVGTVNLDDYIFDVPHHIQRDEGCQAMEENYWGCWGRRILDDRAFFGRGDTPEEATEALKQNILEQH